MSCDRPTKPLLQAQAAAGLGPTRQSRWPLQGPARGTGTQRPPGKGSCPVQESLAAGRLSRTRAAQATCAHHTRPTCPQRPSGHRCWGHSGTANELRGDAPPPKDRPRPWKLSPGRDAERAVQRSSSAHPSALRVHPHAKCHVRANVADGDTGLDETVCLGGAPTPRPPEQAPSAGGNPANVAWSPQPSQPEIAGGRSTRR